MAFSTYLAPGGGRVRRSPGAALGGHGKEVVTKHQESASLTLSDLEVFGTFVMLLTDAQRNDISVITKAVIKSSAATTQRASSSSAATSKRTKKQSSLGGPSKATSHFN